MTISVAGMSSGRPWFICCFISSTRSLPTPSNETTRASAIPPPLPVRGSYAQPLIDTPGAPPRLRGTGCAAHRRRPPEGGAAAGADRAVEDREDQDRRQCPGRQAGGRGEGGQRQRRDHGEGDVPVVADDEAPDGQRGAAHQTAGAPARRVLRSRTIASETARISSRSGARAASPPGHEVPTPSVLQKTPKVVSSTPTANFIAFSGTRARGARAAIPASRTTMTASAAAAAARGISPRLAPKVTTMNATSSPSSRTALKETAKA